MNGSFWKSFHRAIVPETTLLQRRVAPYLVPYTWWRNPYTVLICATADDRIIRDVTTGSIALQTLVKKNKPLLDTVMFTDSVSSYLRLPLKYSNQGENGDFNELRRPERS